MSGLKNRMFGKSITCKAIALKVFTLRGRLMSTCKANKPPEKEGPLRRLNLMKNINDNQIRGWKIPKFNIGNLMNAVLPTRPKTLVEQMATASLDPSNVRFVGARNFAANRTPQAAIYEQHSYRNYGFNPMPLVKVGTGSLEKYTSKAPDSCIATLFAKSDNLRLQRPFSAGQFLQRSDFSMRDFLMILTKDTKNRIAFSRIPKTTDGTEGIMHRLKDRQNMESHPTESTDDAKITRKIKVPTLSETLAQMSAPHFSGKANDLALLPKANVRSMHSANMPAACDFETLKAMQSKKNQQQTAKESKKDNKEIIAPRNLSSTPSQTTSAMVALMTSNKSGLTRNTPAYSLRKLQARARQPIMVRPKVPVYSDFETAIKQIEPKPEDLNETKERNKQIVKKQTVNLQKPKIAKPKLMDYFPSMRLWKSVANAELKRVKSKLEEAKAKARAVGFKQAQSDYTGRKAKMARAESSTKAAKPQHKQATKTMLKTEETLPLPVKRTPVPCYFDKIATAEQNTQQIPKDNKEKTATSWPKPIISIDPNLIYPNPRNTIPVKSMSVDQMPMKPALANPIQKSPKQVNSTTMMVTPKNTVQIDSSNVENMQTAMKKIKEVKQVKQALEPKTVDAINSHAVKMSAIEQNGSKGTDVPLKQSKEGKKAEKGTKKGIVMRSVSKIVKRCRKNSKSAQTTSEKPSQKALAENSKSGPTSTPMPAAIADLEKRQPQQSATSLICREAKTFQDPARRKFY